MKTIRLNIICAEKGELRRSRFPSGVRELSGLSLTLESGQPILVAGHIAEVHARMLLTHGQIMESISQHIQAYARTITWMRREIGYHVGDTQVRYLPARMEDALHGVAQISQLEAVGGGEVLLAALLVHQAAAAACTLPAAALAVQIGRLYQMGDGSHQYNPLSAQNGGLLICSQS